VTVDVAIVGSGQTPMRRRAAESEMHMVFDATQAAIEDAGVSREDIGFTVSGSCDLLAGQSFAFVSTIEAIGAWPPISESHVEMDGAWALYEGWTKLQEGDVDVVLVYCHGRMSAGRPWEVLPLQLDPYSLTPLGLDPGALAALQARQLIDRGLATERDFAEVVARDRANAAGNPNAQVSGTFDVDALLAEPYLREPLRRHDFSPISDGAAAVVLAAGDTATRLSDRPAWITGIDHRIDIHQPGMRDLTESPSAAIAAKEAGVADRPIEVAEITAAFSPQDVILRRAIGLDDSVEMNPSGGALGANPVMVAGLVRIIEAADQVRHKGRHRTLGHATGGQALQQNLVAVLEDTRP
jgi:acetyl-CoA acetyltransferase